MAFLEHGSFCSIEEYARSEQDRITEGQLKASELYMLMLRLDAHEAAAKNPVRLTEIMQKNGAAVVNIAFLNNKLEHQWGATASVVNDYAVGFTSVIIKSPANENYRVEQAYFKDYFDDMYDYVLAQNTSLALA